jgi:NADH-quinone oxidoreductase subunit G
MIEESELLFGKLEPSAFDIPLEFKIDSVIIFSNSGGVTEVVLRDTVNNDFSETCEAEHFVFASGEDTS